MLCCSNNRKILWAPPTHPYFFSWHPKCRYICVRENYGFFNTGINQAIKIIKKKLSRAPASYFSASCVPLEFCFNEHYYIYDTRSTFQYKLKCYGPKIAASFVPTNLLQKKNLANTGNAHVTFCLVYSLEKKQSNNGRKLYHEVVFHHKSV